MHAINQDIPDGPGLFAVTRGGWRRQVGRGHGPRSPSGGAFDPSVVPGHVSRRIETHSSSPWTARSCARSPFIKLGCASPHAKACRHASCKRSSWAQWAK